MLLFNDNALFFKNFMVSVPFAPVTKYLVVLLQISTSTETRKAGRIGTRVNVFLV